MKNSAFFNLYILFLLIKSKLEQIIFFSRFFMVFFYKLKRNFTSGTLIFRLKMSGRDWLPMKSRSPKPLVTTRAIRSPCLSRSAFVATVVPIRIHEIASMRGFFFKFRSKTIYSTLKFFLHNHQCV